MAKDLVEREKEAELRRKADLRYLEYANGVHNVQVPKEVTA